MPTIEGDEWKPYNDDYLISNMGRWFSLKRRKILAQCKNSFGYMRAHISINKKAISVFTHITVVAMFGDCNGRIIQSNKFHKFPPGLSLRELGLSIDHIDKNQHNNSISNLEIVTHSENCIRKFQVPAFVPEGALEY